MQLVLEVLAAVALAQDGKVDFESRVLPILRERCFSCHEAPKTAPDGRVTKPKAGLRLDGRGWILRGSDEQAVLTPGDPGKSRIYSLTVLPADHDDRMPSKGDPLTKAQTESIRLWIAQGAAFGSWKGMPGGKVEAPVAAAPPPPIVSTRLTMLETLGRGVPPASATALDRARHAGAKVEPAMPGSPLLEVSFPSRETPASDKDLEALAPLAAQITRLDLGKTKISDAGLRTLSGFTALTRLDLHGTAVSDAGLPSLKGLSELRSLNLFGTAVTDAGLPALEGLAKLEDVYLRETKVTPAGIERLGGKLSDAEIHADFEAPSTSPGAATGKKKKKK
jgi:hypothetical protein